MTAPETDLPLWLRATIVGIVTLLLATNIIADIFLPDYDGQPISVMLGGVVSASIGIFKIRMRGGDKQ